MSYRITANYFAPKLMNINSNSRTYKKTHCISYNKCNFNCKFCEFHLRNPIIYKEYSDKEFEEQVDILIKKGVNFKFTGGESTLNPKLYEHIKIVKNKGGKIFLDTNGSNPKLVKKLLDENLISVLGISLKSIEKENSIIWSGCNNSKLCWDNVFETIDYSAKNDKVITIVTTVFKNEDNYDALKKFANILSKYENIYLKINNLIGKKHHSNEKMKKVDSACLINWIKELIKNNPGLKGKIIYIDDFSSVKSYENIKFY